jgi:hypothetical protein
MIYRRLDSSGDYCFGRGKQDFVSDTNAVAQAIKTRVLLLSEEWWEDQSDGTPLFQSILGVSGTPENLSAADLIVQDRIINTQNVTEIVDFTRSYENRVYSFKCTVNTVFGTTVTVEVTL